MPLLGAHMSIAGGYYKSVERAAEVGCEVLQCFTKNNSQWRAKEISEEDVERFRDALQEHEILHALSHSSYLINVASPDDALWSKSLEALVVELQRAALLGIPFVVLHPGAHLHLTMDEGIERVAAALDEAHARTSDLPVGCLLETTAGQGTCIGWRFEQLRDILDQVAESQRLGVCVDTCHIFAAGYRLQRRRDYLATIRELDRVVGLERIKAFHLNDSKRELGLRVDRHEHIGQGQLGLEPFRHLLNDKRFRDTPMYLETPKGENDEGELWDAVNLRTLRSLVA